MVKRKKIDYDKCCKCKKYSKHIIFCFGVCNKHFCQECIYSIVYCASCYKKQNTKEFKAKIEKQEAKEHEYYSNLTPEHREALAHLQAVKHGLVEEEKLCCCCQERDYDCCPRGFFDGSCHCSGHYHPKNEKGQRIFGVSTDELKKWKE